MIRLYLNKTEGMNRKFRLEDEKLPTNFSLFSNMSEIAVFLCEKDKIFLLNHLTSYSTFRAESHDFYDLIVESEDMKSFELDIKRLYPEEFI